MLTAPGAPEQPPPPYDPGAPYAGAPPPSGVASQDDRVLAAIAHGSTFFEGGIIAPLVIYFVKRETSPFVAFHALQSMVFGLLFVALTLLTCGFGALVLVWPYVIFEGIATYKSFEGEWYELPIVGAYCRRQITGQA
jgi:uncharacterized membrane protein